METGRNVKVKVVMDETGKIIESLVIMNNLSCN